MPTLRIPTAPVFRPLLEPARCVTDPDGYSSSAPPDIAGGAEVAWSLKWHVPLPPVDLTLDEAVAVKRKQGIAGLQARSVLAR
jgi:hypothetical protein